MITVLRGHVLDVLRTLPDESVHCCVTSPPYWGLRDYGLPPQVWPDGWEGSLGLEPTPELYLLHMVEVFREVKRVLRKDGTAWVNMGDCYAANRGYQVADSKHREVGNYMSSDVPPGLKPKDLVGMPWRLAFALQADGWWLRSDIIWAKPNPMPESVTDRPTKAHEYLFLLTKAERYFYDAEAVRESAEYGRRNHSEGWLSMGEVGHRAGGGSVTGSDPSAGRNLRTVWTIPTQPFPEAHFATFPEALVKPCILAGTSEEGCCPECGQPWERVVERGRVSTRPCLSTKYGTPEEDIRGGSTNLRERQIMTPISLGFRPTCPHEAEPVPAVVLDPFGGSGTVGVVARKLGRSALLIELKPDYADMAERRIEEVNPTFAEAEVKPNGHQDVPKELSLFAVKELA